MSHPRALPLVNWPFINHLVAARVSRLLSSRALPTGGNPGIGAADASVGRSGSHVSVNYAVRKVCCIEIHGMYFGRSAATMKRVNSVQADPVTSCGDEIA